MSREPMVAQLKPRDSAHSLPIFKHRNRTGRGATALGWVNGEERKAESAGSADARVKAEEPSGVQVPRRKG